MNVMMKAFETSVRRGIARIEKDVNEWLEMQPDIAVEQTSLQTVGEKIVFILLYSDAAQRSAHEPYAGSQYYAAAALDKEDTEELREDAEESPRELEDPILSSQKGLSINHLFGSK